jgi:hypothetical protein
MSDKRMWLIALLIGLIGCDHYEYRLVMTPRGQELQRDLNYWQTDTAGTEPTTMPTSRPSSDVGPGELERLQGVYDAPPVRRGSNVVSFSKLVTGRMPDDIGGAGWYETYPTPLGTAFAYLEQFRGNDDLLARQEQILSAVNELADVLLGWLDTQPISQKHGYAALREFLTTQVRHDAKNLALMLKHADQRWPESTDSCGADPEHDLVARWLAYLGRRSYIDRNTLPQWDEFFDSPAGLMISIRRAAQARLGTSPAVAELASMADEDRWPAMRESLGAYVMTTEPFARRRQQWEDRRKEQATPVQTDTKPSEEEFSARYYWSAVFEEAADFGFGSGFDSGGPDRLVVFLKLPDEPLFTNGRRDADQRTVVWDSRLPDRDEAIQPLPETCYALWVQANIEAQQAHFGKLALEGVDLLHYCMWYTNLPGPQKQDWDALLARLNGGPAVLDTLKQAQEAVEPASQASQPADRPDRERYWLIKSLIEKLEKTPATQPAKP